MRPSDRLRKYRSSSNPPQSVFEDELNSTDVTRKARLSGRKRWKYKGPWLPGKNEGEFQDYVNGEIKRRRPEFQKFVRKWLEGKKAAGLLGAATAKGKRAEAVLKNVVKISDEELREGIIKLRQESTDLWALIWEFLDLPGAPPQDTTHPADDMANSTGLSIAATDIDQGPPITHPSAGLSYLRTASTVSNHPVLGPMTYPHPVQGRIMQYGPAPGNSKQNRILVGVAGVVGTDDVDKPFSETEYDEPLKFDPDLVGGTKIWVHPRRAVVDSKGRIKLTVHRASRNTRTLWGVEESKKSELDDVVKGVDKAVPDLSPSSRTRARSMLPEAKSGELLNLPANRKGGFV